MKLDPQTVRIWKERWEAVALFEAEERRRLTPTDKLRQIAQGLQMSRALGVPLTRNEREEKEIRQVRSRWVRLKKWMKNESQKTGAH